MAAVLVHTVDQYQIHGKVGSNHPKICSDSDLDPGQVGWLTSDGASVNRTTIREFAKLLTEADENWLAAEHQSMTCCEFSVLVHSQSQLHQEKYLEPRASQEVPQGVS